eukprot:1698735-Rhodomonas_salina.2
MSQWAISLSVPIAKMWKTTARGSKGIIVSSCSASVNEGAPSTTKTTWHPAASVPNCSCRRLHAALKPLVTEAVSSSAISYNAVRNVLWSVSKGTKIRQVDDIVTKQIGSNFCQRSSHCRK